VLSTIEVARTLGLHRVTLQKWIRVGRVKPPKLTIRNGRAVRLWTPADVEKLKELKERKDWLNRSANVAKAHVALLKQEREERRRAKAAAKS
jgi:DNA-binding transcriptional MerR regulator